MPKAGPARIEPGPAGAAFTPSFAWLFAIFAGELVLISLRRIPDSLAFGNFAFCDQGANLTAQYLVAHGYRPGLDFGYHYGLLALLFMRIWFSAFGLTPHAYLAAMLACNVLFAWALARLFSALKPGPVGLAFTLVTLGYAMQPTYPNAAHAIETVLLAHALAEQARGARANALALAAFAAFVKPSMGYIFGLVLLAIMIRDLWKRRATAARWVECFAPAVGATALCAVAIGSVFGVADLLRTILPIQGAVAYHVLDYGFFLGSGSALWAAPRMPWIYYFIYIPGLWIGASIYLLAAGSSAAIALWRRSGAQTKRDEIILTCAVLHLAFVALLFGNQWSWIYYFYFLSIGVAAAADLSPLRRRAAWILCILALFSWTATIHAVTRERRTTAIYPDTGGLYASPEQASEWRHALDTVRNSAAVILYTKGSAELTYPEFAKPVTLYLDRGLMEPAEIQRKLAQLSSARFVVVPESGQTCRSIPDAPEFSSAMGQFEPVSKGEFFDLFRRQ